MYPRTAIDPFVSVRRRGKALGLNVELENLSLSRKVQAALTQPTYAIEKRASLAGDRIERLFARPQFFAKH